MAAPEDFGFVADVPSTPEDFGFEADAPSLEDELTGVGYMGIPYTVKSGKFAKQAVGALAKGSMRVGEAFAAIPENAVRLAKTIDEVSRSSVEAGNVGSWSPVSTYAAARRVREDPAALKRIESGLTAELKSITSMHLRGQEAILAAHPEWESDPPENFVDLLTSPRKLALSILESAPLLVAAGITTAAGQPAISVAMMTVTEAQEMKNQALADGRTEYEAQMAGLLYGPIAGALEQMQLQGIISIAKGVYKPLLGLAAKKVAAKGMSAVKYPIIKTAINEALEEMAQGTWQEATAKIVYDKSIPDGLGGFIDRRAQEGYIGGVMGLIPGAGGMAIRGVTKTAQVETPAEVPVTPAAAKAKVVLKSKDTPRRTSDIPGVYLSANRGYANAYAQGLTGAAGAIQSSVPRSGAVVTVKPSEDMVVGFGDVMQSFEEEDFVAMLTQEGYEIEVAQELAKDPKKAAEVIGWETATDFMEQGMGYSEIVVDSVTSDQIVKVEFYEEGKLVETIQGDAAVEKGDRVLYSGTPFDDKIRAALTQPPTPKVAEKVKPTTPPKFEQHPKITSEKYKWLQAEALKRGTPITDLTDAQKTELLKLKSGQTNIVVYRGTGEFIYDKLKPGNFVTTDKSVAKTVYGPNIIQETVDVKDLRYYRGKARIPGVEAAKQPPTLELIYAPTVEPVIEKKRKPYKSQYIAGHDIPKILDMSEAERRKFMKKTTGETSMAKMTPSAAQEYIDALHELARKKGIETGVMPQERVFKKPIIGLTPQLYKAKVLGVEFMIQPAALGKQKFDLEFSKEARQVDKMEHVINRLGGETVKTRAAAKLKNRPTKSVARFAELLNKYEDPPESLSKEEKDVFNYYRTLSRTIIARENKVREELNMEPIEYRPGYMRHIVDVMAQDMMEGRHPIPEELKYWAEEHASKKIRNPMEFQRRLGDELEDIFSNDLTKATKAMLWTGLKEIHLDKPLKFFESQIGLHSEVIPDSTRRWAESFINHMIVGKQTAVDQRLNDMVKDSGIGRVINQVLKPFGRKISHKPLTKLMAKAGRLQIYGVMGWRPKQLLRNKFQFFQNLALYTTKASIKSFLPASKQLKELMSDSLFLKTYRGFEDLTEIDKRTLGKLWLAPFQWTAVTNAKRGMKVAYHDTLDLIENPKYKDHGWADPERTYTEDKGFLYPSEKQRLLEEMEFGAGVTQYHYIPMAMPGVFKYKVATPLTRLQSWWMNYFFKFHREAANRFFTGKTREGLELPWSRRIGWGRYMVIGGVVLNTLGYTSSYLFGAAPEDWPPLAQLLISMYRYTVTDNERAKANAKRKFLYALKTFVPGYLAAKDVSVMLDKDKSWTDLLFYSKGIFAKDEESTGGTRRPVTEGQKR